jgi:hypothetical protein
VHTCSQANRAGKKSCHEVHVSCTKPAFVITAVPSCLALLQAVDFVRKRLKAGEALKSICEQMCDHCLAPDTGGCGKGCDNMSVVVVLLKEFMIK